MANSWVLVRGIVSEEFHWWQLPELLGHRFPETEVYAADIFGNGKSHYSSTPIRIPKNIQSLRSQVPQPGKKILVGFSLGAMLALEWAYAFPEEVAGVVLINASLKSSPFYQRLTPSAFAQIFRASRQKNFIEREKMILRLTTGLPEEQIAEIAPHWAERSEMFPMGMKNFFLQLFLGFRIRQRPALPQAPVLVLRSKNDKVVLPVCSETLAKAWGLPVQTHPTAGHDLTLEDPHWVLDQIESWMQSEGRGVFEAPVANPDLRPLA